MRIGWIKFREFNESLLGKRFSLKIKQELIRVMSGLQCCMAVKEKGILRRTKRAISGAKLADRKNTENMMDVGMGLNQTIDKMAKANGVRWLGHALRKEDGDVKRSAPEFNVEGRRKTGRPKRTWRKQVDKERLKAGLN